MSYQEYADRSIIKVRFESSTPIIGVGRYVKVE